MPQCMYQEAKSIPYNYLHRSLSEYSYGLWV